LVGEGSSGVNEGGVAIPKRLLLRLERFVGRGEFSVVNEGDVRVTFDARGFGEGVPEGGFVVLVLLREVFEDEFLEVDRDGEAVVARRLRLGGSRFRLRCRLLLHRRLPFPSVVDRLVYLLLRQRQLDIAGQDTVDLRQLGESALKRFLLRPLRSHLDNLVELGVGGITRQVERVVLTEELPDGLLMPFTGAETLVVVSSVNDAGGAEGVELVAREGVAVDGPDECDEADVGGGSEGGDEGGEVGAVLDGVVVSAREREESVNKKESEGGGESNTLVGEDDVLLLQRLLDRPEEVRSGLLLEEVIALNVTPAEEVGELESESGLACGRGRSARVETGRGGEEDEPHP
jgi:hypothetical protein